LSDEIRRLPDARTERRPELVARCDDGVAGSENEHYPPWLSAQNSPLLLNEFANLVTSVTAPRALRGNIALRQSRAKEQLQ
jgi:hypothetical protein